MKNKHLTPFVSILGFITLLFSCKDERVHIFEEYSPSGKLIKTHEYIILYGDTILQGKFVNYNENGIKIAEGKYVENERKGICKNYYDDGKIKSIFYRKNSKIDLEVHYYYSNGEIRKYVMCNDIGEPKFIISYDKKGPMQYEGCSLLGIYQNQFTNQKKYNTKTEQVLKVGDVVKYHYLLANIPNAKRSFKIENISIDEKKVKRKITKKSPTSIIIEEVLTKKGVNTIRAITQYMFKDNIMPAINDTVSFDINVK